MTEDSLNGNLEIKLREIETQIEALSYHKDLAQYKIAEYLAMVQDNALWQHHYNDDGRTPYHFKQYLKMLAIELTDKGLPCSEGNFERMLSNYRLFVCELGMSIKNILKVGPTNLDELRKIIDWKPKERIIGEGTDIKMNREEAIDYIGELLYRIENDERIRNADLRDEVHEKLGRTPFKMNLVWQEKDGKHFLRDMQIWEGAEVHVPSKGVEERVKAWLHTRTRASSQEIQ